MDHAAHKQLHMRLAVVLQLGPPVVPLMICPAENALFLEFVQIVRMLTRESRPRQIAGVVQVEVRLKHEEVLAAVRVILTLLEQSLESLSVDRQPLHGLVSTLPRIPCSVTPDRYLR